MEKYVIFEPYAESVGNAFLNDTDGELELFFVGFRLQDYLSTCPIHEQRVFMGKVETVFEKYTSISPTSNITPAEGIELIENIRIGTISGASDFAKKLKSHPFLRDEFLKLYPYL
jgi:hypothetical protein